MGNLEWTFATVVDECLETLQDGISVREAYPLLRQVEQCRVNEYGPQPWPALLYKLDSSTGDFEVATSEPHKDRFFSGRVPERLTDEENKELRSHLIRVLRAWKREAARLAGEGEVYPLQPKFNGVAPPEVAEAIRRVIPDWDGVNWQAVRVVLRNAGEDWDDLATWSMDRLRHHCGSGYPQITLRLTGTVETNKNLVTTSGAGIQFGEVAIETQRQPTGNRGKVKVKTTRSKKSTKKGDAEAKLKSALTKHHQYFNGGCDNLEPIGSNALARKADVDNGSATYFFKKHFMGYGNYKSQCANKVALVFAMKILNEEIMPSILNGKSQLQDHHAITIDERDDE